MHVEYRACFCLPNQAPPRSCTSRIQRGPSTVSHTQGPDVAQQPQVDQLGCAATGNQGWTRAFSSQTDPCSSFSRTRRAKTKQRRATVGHKDFVFFLYAIDVQREWLILAPSVFQCSVVFLFAYSTASILKKQTNKKTRWGWNKSAFTYKSEKLLCLSSKTQSCTKFAEFYPNF